MTNRVVIFALAILFIAIGGLGAYAFNLNDKIVALTELQENTNRQLNSLQDNIGTLENNINTLENRISALITRVENITPAIDAKIIYQEVKTGTVEAVTKTDEGEERSGSGFVLDNEGHIATAYHIVQEADSIDVIFYDGTISAASVTGYCPYSDIAILELEQTVAPQALALGDSDTTAIGEAVITIGSPFDLSGTVTSGIISQKGRFVDIGYNDGDHRWVANLLQYDASVNPGNSGGPLVNAEGEVIGLAIARVAPQKGDGIYYAVSSNKLKRVALSIIDHGSFAYPWLGVQLTDLTPEEARSQQLDAVSGTVVTSTPFGPAILAGVKVDDVIVAIDGTPINETADLASYLGENKSPQELTVLTIIRNGERLELSVPLDERPS